MRTPANTSHPLLLWAWSLIRLDFVGVGFGALSFCPSLLPRDWLFQGLIGGVTASIGYAIGVGLEKYSTTSFFAAGGGGRRRKPCRTGCGRHPAIRGV